MNDPFDILRSYEPVDVTEIESYADAHAESVKQRILASPRPVAGEGGGRGRPWRRAAAGAASVAVLAAAAFIATRAVEDTDAVVCYADVDLTADRIGVQPDRIDLSACSDVWSDGSLVNEAIVPAGEIPPLIGCVDEDGTLNVFPTSDAGACARLGLAGYDDGPAPETDAIVMVQESLRVYLSQSSCAGLAETAAEAEAQLAAEGLSEWAVVVDAGPADRPCASFAVDDAAMTIHIVPVPAA